MKFTERIEEIFKQPICDNCAGRNFAQLLSGYSNKERGRILRTVMTMTLDSGEKIDCNLNNFYGFKFRFNKDLAKLKLKKEKCSVCDDLFNNLDKIAEKIEKKLKGIDFETFLVGTRPSKELIKREEEFWERVGIEFCEPIKSEINREIGKILEKRLNKKAELKKPDISVLIDLENNKIGVKINPLYIFGFYKKLVRGIPQCRWGTPGKYKTSVQEIIAKPIMKVIKGKDHLFHGAGREDVSARCLDWRAFVIEILSPKIRKIDLKRVEREIKKTKKIEVKGLKFSDMSVVRKIKKAIPEKTYRTLVKIDKPISRKELKKLNTLKGTIEQRTPKRVLHRRADLLRRREVKSIKYKMKDKKTLELEVKGSSGLYIKELISGDEGRTKPSVAELLNRKAVCKELDVIKIEKIKI